MRTREVPPDRAGNGLIVCSLAARSGRLQAMIISPRVRGFICTTAHPVGCARLVENAVAWVRQQPALDSSGAPANVLVVGGSAGYGLASRIVTAFGYRANTLSVSLEKTPTADSTGSAGWYSNRAFDRLATRDGLYAKTIEADAFADATKAEVAELVRCDLGGLDLLIYSLASPVRRDPDNGTLFRSVIKPVGQPVRIKTLNVAKGTVHDMDLEPADDAEIQATVKVMGGEDWARWMAHLELESLLRPGFRTLACTYIGSDLTRPIYWNGTLGRAKEDVDRTAASLRQTLEPIGGDARVVALKAVVTQASAAIPAIPLYASLLFKVMKERGSHEDCLQQMHRLFRRFRQGRIDSGALDDLGRIRLDDWELEEGVQTEVRRRWTDVNTENVLELSDLAGFRRDFLRIFGFEVPGIDYGADVSPIG
jgi:enoyl-[acyl-carrier protein] reductase/trans-2-enoyl-CoA reductase (NAD+)